MEPFSVTELKGDPQNPRTISKDQYAKLKELLDKFGDLSGIIRNVRTDELIGGHMRTRAFIDSSSQSNVQVTQRFETPTKAGTVAVGYVIVNGEMFSYREVDWTIGMQKAANLAANKAGGEFDKDMLAEVMYEISELEDGADLLKLTAFADDEVSKLLDSVGGVSDPAEDEAPAVDESSPAVSKLGEIYQLGSHRLMCGSSDNAEQVGALMGGAKADLILTDPPYGYKYESNHSDKHEMLMNDDVFVDFMPQALAISKPNCAFYIFGGWQTLSEWINIVKDSGIDLKNIIIWKKNNWSMGDLKSAYAGQYEIILFAIKGHVELRQGRDRDVWEFDREPPTDHPTMKPVELLSKAIMQSSDRGEVVVDLFGGSGSTLIACETNHRINYTMELDPRYVDVIRKRYARHMGLENDWISATPVVQTVEIKAPEPKEALDEFAPPELPPAE